LISLFHNQLFIVVSMAQRKHFSWTSLGPLKMEKPDKIPFYKISYHGFTYKQTLILVSPLSFKNSNPYSKKKC